MDVSQLRYVPVLRWKQAELDALAELREEDKKQVIPLIELTQAVFAPKQPTQRDPHPQPPDVQQVVTKKVEALHKTWSERPVMLDLWHVDPTVKPAHREHLFDELAFHGANLGMRIIPVTGFTAGDPEKGLSVRTHAYQAAVKRIVKAFGSGVALRLLPSDLQATNLEDRIHSLLNYLSLERERTDIILDLQVVQQPLPGLSQLLSRLPCPESWRTVILSSGAFPRDLSNIRAHTTAQLDRWDWNIWSSLCQGDTALTRKPTYADYTIQHAYFRESAQFSPSASIRYTAESYWLIYRGEKFKPGGPSANQYPAEAILLCDREEYCGEGFSYGDGYILHKSLNPAKPGNARTWLCAGINHHITFVLRQLREADVGSVAV